MIDRAKFFAAARKTVFAPVLEQTEVAGTEATLDAMEADNWPIPWMAYGLATKFHETDHTMQPIKEYGGPAYFFRMYDPKGSRPALAKRNGNIYPGDGVRYCGRGDVQITWRSNYARVGKLIGADLESNPERALEPAIAAKIMVGGMRHGWFTGRKLSDYDLPGGGYNHVAARAIINGKDKAQLIAGYAKKFEAALTSASI
jgi:putative chitinase